MRKGKESVEEGRHLQQMVYTSTVLVDLCMDDFRHNENPLLGGGDLRFHLEFSLEMLHG